MHQVFDQLAIGFLICFRQGGIKARVQAALVGATREDEAMLPVLCFFQAEDGIRVVAVTGVQTCALPIYGHCDFFKNNAYFAHTSRKMMDEMANHGRRLRRYAGKQGEDEAERSPAP